MQLKGSMAELPQIAYLDLATILASMNIFLYVVYTTHRRLNLCPLLLPSPTATADQFIARLLGGDEVGR